MIMRLYIAITIAVLLFGCSKKQDAAPAPKTELARFNLLPTAAAGELDGIRLKNSTAKGTESLLITAALLVAVQQAAGKPNLAKGQAVYNTVCTACHTAGVGGAPKLGDKADWAARIKQGDGVLFQHAKNGFTGKKGMMPPKGGNPALSDSDLKNAIAYMKSKAQ